MPKRVDVAERRELIVTALMRVAARDGLEAVSLRHVAAEAGVTAGMVQHWFDSKHSMVEYAIEIARTRYAARIAAGVAELGDHPRLAELLRVLVGGLVPLDAGQRDDARVALEFRAYAATHQASARRLADDDAQLRAAVADAIAAARTGVDDDANECAREALALTALAEGLAMAILAGSADEEEASLVLHQHIERVADGAGRPSS